MRRIVIVGDSVSTQQIQIRLEKMNYQVDTTDNIAEFRNKLQDNKINLVVLDQQVIDSSSIELVEKIHTDLSMQNIALIFFIDSKESDQDKQHTFQHGANDYFSQSTSDIELEMKLSAHIGQQLYQKSIIEDEHMVSAIINNANDGIITIDDQGLIREFNPKAQSMFKYPKYQVLGHSLEVLLGDEWKPRFDQYLRGYLKDDERMIPSGSIGQGKRKDGSEFQAEIAISETKLDLGKHIFTIFIRDITDRLRTEEELLEARSLSSLSMMTASIAHEMRQPLTAADLDLSDISSCESNEERSDLIESARTNVQDALLTIRAMMKVFRNKNNAECQEININAVIKETLNLMQRLSRGVKVKYHLDQNAVIHTSKNLSRILVNLIGNALDALNNEGELIISSKLENEKVHIGIEDNGPGIPSKIVKDIFKPQFTTKKSGSGTGLGLWIADQEVRRMNGSISLDSVVGRYTRFTVSIPKSERTSNAK